ncbi:MAG: hypothetical protein V3R20_03785, partial [Sphingomonadales bacterium]
LEKELQYFKELLEANTEKVIKAEERAVAAEVKAEEATRVAENATDSRKVKKLADTQWHLSGYADAGAMFQTGGDDDSFVFGHFNPGFHFQYKDIVIFEAELEFEVSEDGETEVELEYAALDFLVHNNATIVIGKFLSPIGQFQERLHPTWINKIGNAPAGFGHDGAQPASEVGVQVRGGISIGKRSMVTYAVMVGNGPRMGHEAGLELEGFGADDNQNKAFGGRIGILPLPYFEIGGSFMKAKVDGLEGFGELMPTTGDVTILGADAAYTRGPWDFRFEYLKLTRDPLNSAEEDGEEVEALEQMEMKAWYVQLAYRFSEITTSPILQRFEPVVRYGKFNISGNHHLEEENAQTRLNIGVNYWIAPSLVARIGFEQRKFLVEGTKEKRILLQAAYGF